jgi:hypothetical protein
MLNLTIEDQSFQLAESWSEITFSQYLDIINILKDEGLNELLKSVKIISYISDKPEECEAKILKISKEDFESLTTYFEWTNKKIDEYATEKESLEINGKQYRIKKEHNKLTLGEMVSIETLIEHNKNLDPFEVVFGVLLREVVDGKEKEFDEEDFIKIITELMDKVMLLDIYSHITFFLSGAQKSTSKISKGFSIHQMAKSS